MSRLAAQTLCRAIEFGLALAVLQISSSLHTLLFAS